MYILDIIIPHYKETPEMVNQVLSSINLQVGFNLKETIKVTIVNDHEPSAYKALEEYLKTHTYQFDIELLQTSQNVGGGETRQYGLDHTSAPMVMFIDADDYLYACDGLIALLNMAIQANQQGRSWAYIWGDFYEEQILPNNKGYNLINHNTMSMIWLHGKLWNRAYLKEKDIHFYPGLRTFEDSYFGKTAALLAKPEEILHCPHSVYFWKRNPNSITSHWNHDDRPYIYWHYQDGTTCNYQILRKLEPAAATIQPWFQLVVSSTFFNFFVLSVKGFEDRATNPETEKVCQAYERNLYLMATRYKDIFTQAQKGLLEYLFQQTRIETTKKFELHVEKESWNDCLDRIGKNYQEDLSWLKF